MDDQAEEDLHHEDASSIDSVDSTPTGSVDSGRSAASEARQPLFSAAALRGLVGWAVRHLCIQAIGQRQLDVTGSNRSASAVKAWRLTLEPEWFEPQRSSLSLTLMHTKLAVF